MTNLGEGWLCVTLCGLPRAESTSTLNYLGFCEGGQNHSWDSSRSRRLGSRGGTTAEGRGTVQRRGGGGMSSLESLESKLAAFGLADSVPPAAPSSSAASPPAPASTDASSPARGLSAKKKKTKTIKRRVESAQPAASSGHAAPRLPQPLGHRFGLRGWQEAVSPPAK